MKKIFIFSLLFLLSYSFLHSQSSPPELISYQGIARDAAGNILPNQPIGIQLIIHQGSTGGPPVFTEQHAVTTNSLGLFYLQIGANNPSAFQAITWNNGPYFLEVLLDPTGGSSYTSIGTQQLLSVPYALYAKSSYSSAISFASYTTTNAPPITITTNTSPSSTTLNIIQGSNTTSTTINFPPSVSSITMNASGIASVSPNTGNNFNVNVPPPSLQISSGTSDATITITQGTAVASQTLSFPPASVPNVSINAAGIVTVTPTSGTAFTIGAPSPTISNGTGIAVLGSYPNYTINNTAPNQIVNINAGNSNINVSGSYPNYIISSNPTLTLIGNNLSISNGNTVTLPSTITPTIIGGGITNVNPTSGFNFTVSTPNPTFTNGTGINVTGSYPTFTIANTAPNQTVNIYSGNPNINISGIYPNYTISSSPTLSIVGTNSLTISNGNTVALPASNVTLTGVGVANVSPTSGNIFTVNVPAPSIAATSNTTTGVATLTLTQGSSTSTTSINMPVVSNPNITGISPVIVTPSSNNFTVSLQQQTLSLSGNGASTSYSINSTHGGIIALPSPTWNITPPHSIILSTGGYANTISMVPPALLPTSASTANIASVTSNTSILQYSINVPPPSILVTNGVGQSTLSLIQGPATATAIIAPAASPTVVQNEWHITGNSGTNPSSNFIGTTDANDFVIRTSNTERMRISSSGNVGIGTSSPLYPLHTVYSGTNGNVHYINYTSTSASGANSAIYTIAQNTTGGNIFGGYFQVSGSNSSNTAAAIKGFATSNASNFNYGIDASAIGTTTGTNYGGNFYASNGATNYGIYTETNATSNNSAGIYAVSSGAAGVAGRFMINNNSNSSPVLEVINSTTNNNPLAIFNGNGNVGIGTTTPSSKLDVVSTNTTIAVHAQTNGSTALWIDNGHIKSTMPISPITALGNNLNFTITTHSVVPGSNDVRGRIDIAFNATAITSYAYCEVKVQFNKLYSSTPFVTVSPMTELPDGVNYCISSITSSEFVLKIYKPNLISISSGIYTTRFYYFVIE